MGVVAPRNRGITTLAKPYNDPSMNKTHKHSLNSPLAPLILLVVCILAYGLLIPSLGYYWDDLPYALVYQRFGPGGYPAFVASDRPFSAWVFVGLTWLLGEQPLGHHIAGLLLYWLSAVLLWHFISLLWPHHKKEALWAALLFAVYPGFLGQPKTFTYHHHFSAMALYLFSLIATVKAVHVAKEKGRGLKSWRWHIPAVLAAALSQFTIEYFLGWEAVRIAIIWLVSSRYIPGIKQRVRYSMLYLVPYGLVTIGFVYWRVFIFRFPTYQPTNLSIGITDLSWWLFLIGQVVEATFLAWHRVLPQWTQNAFGLTVWWTYLILSLSSIAIIFLVFHCKFKEPDSIQPDQAIKTQQNFGKSAIIIALFGISFAGWPFWLVNLNLSIVYHFRSRFTLAFIPWIALLITALLHLLSRVRLRPMKIITTGIVALLVGGSIGWHFLNSNFYRNQWILVQRYFQQLVYRAPGLEQGTILLVNDMPSIVVYQDDSLTSLLNWTYTPKNKTPILDYAMFYLSVRLGNELPALEPGLPIEEQWRSFQFSSSTDNILVVHFEPPSCLRVLDRNQPDRIPLSLSQSMLPALPLSNLDVIQTDPTAAGVPQIPFFDLPETPSWCLFFQQAELAAQRGDWKQVAELGDLAYTVKNQSVDITENFVFIEGYLRDNNLSRAFEISKSVNDATQNVYIGRICNLWRTVENDLPLEYDQMADYQDMLGNICFPE